MIVCEFCMQYEPDGTCRLGLKIPKTMGCAEFDPALEKFCSNPKDFVSPAQIVHMAAYFGIKGRELKKVNLMAAREGHARSQPPAPYPAANGSGAGGDEGAGS